MVYSGRGKERGNQRDIGREIFFSLQLHVERSRPLLWRWEFQSMTPSSSSSSLERNYCRQPFPLWWCVVYLRTTWWWYTLSSWCGIVLWQRPDREAAAEEANPTPCVCLSSIVRALTQVKERQVGSNSPCLLACLR